jgi:hypothetical protein
MHLRRIGVRAIDICGGAASSRRHVDTYFARDASMPGLF